MKKFLTKSTTAVAAMVAIIGRSSTGNAKPGLNHGTSTEQAPTLATEHNGAAAMSAQMVMPHHAQAVQKREIMLEKLGQDATTSTLAKDIKTVHGPEIAALTTWGEPATMAGDHPLTGMIARADVDKLKAAHGPYAAKLFLTQWTAYHEGALKWPSLTSPVVKTPTPSH